MPNASRQTVQPQLATRLYPLVALVLLLLLAGCAEDDLLDPEQQIRLAIEQAERAIEQRSVGETEPFIAEQYQDPAGRDRRQLLGLLRGYFLTHQSIHLLHQIKDIELLGEGRAQVQLYVATAGKPIESIDQLISLRAELLSIELKMQLDDGQWRVVSSSWRRAGREDFLY